ncbi:hypothetical protein QQS35_16940, partial [Aquibacillus sp. LR5S19]|nr:hypothetical protein [Aquibacillus sp. LR5S19]
KQRQGEQTSVEDIVLISNTALQTLIGQKVSQIPYNVMTTEIVQDRVKAAKSAKASMEVMKNILLDEAKKMGVKTTNSVLEIFSTIVNDHIERSDKTFDSVGDFGNAMTFGVPKGIYQGLMDNYYQMLEDPSLRTISNYLSVGATDMVIGAVNPEDPLSADHLLNSFGFASTVVGGGAYSKVLGDSNLSMPTKETVITPQQMAKEPSEVGRATLQDMLDSLQPYRMDPALGTVGGPMNLVEPGLLKQKIEDTYSLFAKGNKIDSDTIKKYIRDIEGRTGRELPKNQTEKLKEALRNKEYKKMSLIETAKHRAVFDKVKNKVIKDWEENTGQKWPVYNENVISEKTGKIIRKQGDKYDAHHIIENTFGGEHEWWNMHPAKFPNEHQAGIHGAGSPANTLFKGGKK